MNRKICSGRTVFPLLSQEDAGLDPAFMVYFFFSADLIEIQLGELSDLSVSLLNGSTG